MKLTFLHRESCDVDQTWRHMRTTTSETFTRKIGCLSCNPRYSTLRLILRTPVFSLREVFILGIVHNAHEKVSRLQNYY